MSEIILSFVVGVIVGAGALVFIAFHFSDK